MTNRDWARRADQLSAQAYSAGEPTAWFDRLYAEGAAGTIEMPWSRTDPHPLLRRWIDERPAVEPARACVVGCGLGADAEFLAGRGWTTTGFDLSPTAVEQARARHPGSAVTYRVADLLQLPDDLVGAFDLVVEIHTLQAMPNPPRAGAARGVASLLTPGGTLFVVQFRDTGVPTQPPPFPLSRDDLALLEVGGVVPVLVGEVDGPLWRAEFVRRV
ncbi:class I SAM-dependent methyltransferase [Nakamurella sp.]|uniref:class I SAM-dependent methyltransferase n=1 Tax=Nakamurella sp. TaxID=1869182 RepID=UPI0037831021